MRIFLDSSTLQYMRTYGGFVYDGEAVPASDRIYSIPEGMDNLEALYNIFRVVDRTSIVFAVSDFSLQEAALYERDPGHLGWVFDVYQYCQDWLDESGGVDALDISLAQKLTDRSFGFLGSGDRKLLSDAIALGCDMFLTTERRLPKNATYVKKHLGIEILTPVQLWAFLSAYPL